MRVIRMYDLKDSELPRHLEQLMAYEDPRLGFIDEVALLCRGDVQDTLAKLETHGYRRVYFTADTVEAMPFGCKYLAEYHFLQRPESARTFRIELLRVVAGTSPVHAPFLNVIVPDYMIQVVHASFKCKDLAIYQAMLRTLQDGYVVAQECKSDYGLFSYWLPRLGTEMLYLKPRVNLRDQEAR